MSHGLFDGVVGLRLAVGLALDNPIVVCAVGCGVSDLEVGNGPSRDVANGVVVPEPSPNRTKASIVLSRFPLTPFRTITLRLSSINPISLSWDSFCAIASALSFCKLAPKTEDLPRSAS